jgi:RHS repeat-associated protein
MNIMIGQRKRSAPINMAKTEPSEFMDYDEVYRLISANGPWGSGSYTYDNNNNITKQTLGVNTSTYNYDEDTNLLMNITGANAQTFNYAEGNATQMGALNLGYNSLNQVIKIAGTNPVGQAVNDIYGYDGNENRLVTINNDGTALEAYNEQSQLMYKANLTQNNQVAYINLGGDTIIRLENYNGTTKATYLANNLLGSPLDATDESGASMQWTERYRPYGDEMDPITTRDNPHIGYTGKPHNVQTGLSYYGARYYYPSIGRFLSMDPAKVKPEMPVTFNRYAYAANNPYAYKDDDGREFISAGVGAVIGGLEGYHDYGWKGAVFGALIGGAVGFTDPAASRLVTGLGLKGLARIGAQFGFSATINTAGNMAYSKAMTGSFNPGASLVGGLMGGMGGLVGEKMVSGVFSSGVTMDSAIGNFFKSPSAQNAKAKVSEGFAATLSGTLNVASTNAASNTNHDNKASNTGGSKPNSSGNNNAGGHSSNNSHNQS